MSKRTKETRREFLKGMAILGGATLAVASRPGAMAVPEAAEKPTAPAPKGYHVTTHILDYYEKARS